METPKRRPLRSATVRRVLYPASPPPPKCHGEDKSGTMSEYCLQPCSTNQNIMFVRTREPIADDVFSPASSPKRLCLDAESRNSCDVDTIARIMTPTPPSESPMKRALQDVTLRCNNSGSSSPSSLPASPGTPTKSTGDLLGSTSDDPMTPTARLKLLSHLAAERLPYTSGENGVDDELSNHSSNSENQKPTSRKDKSLGLLCQAFLGLYPEYTVPSDNIIVSLDEVAKHLGVERRRVYDIVNVLESVGMVTKEAKNKYRWFGKGALLETLPKLKALSEKSNIAGQIHSVKDFEFHHSLEMSSQLFVVPSNEAINSGQVTAASMVTDSVGGGGCSVASIQDLELRREKSMGIMSQRFLMLFLTSPPKTVSLDLAAKVLIGDPTVDKTQSLVYKTKIRRLYDIANILTSLGLIRKVTVTESRGRKSAFKYIGPDIGTASTDEDVQVQTQSRHSLVATGFSLKKALNAKDENTVPAVQSPGSSECTAQVLELLQRTQERSKRSSTRLVRTHSDDVSAPSRKCRRGPQLSVATNLASSSKTLARHASFHDICEVAEMERRRLYSEEEESQRELSARNVAVGNVGTVAGINKPIGIVKSEVDGASLSIVPTPNVEQAEAKESEPSASTESHVITLSEEQYTSLLQSLNLPIHSKPIISIQQEKKAEQPCKCSGSQQLQTQPKMPQQVPAQQTPAQATPAKHAPAQQTPGQQTTTVLAAAEVPAILTPTFRWFIEHDQRTPSASSGTEEVIAALALPAAARKLTYDSVPTTPVSPGTTEDGLVLSLTAADAADDVALKLPTTTAAPAGTMTPLTPNYYACFVRGPSSSPEVLPLVTTAASSSSSPQIPIFSPTNCMFTLSPVVLGAANHGQAAMSTIAFPAGTRLLTATTPGAAPAVAAPEKKASTAARKLTLTK
ncbi:hypothetical protein HPB50_008146 [Hyalomma asiaticum]|uniref:Uncharacterized protein n=1 Tax=Hyalomma asiaticum TaxID=266040 RepID=A0ACB7RPU8_HYAAI|nr:hypothetical protein HPB50_008146 [Hyalomma asiaticum]